MAYQFSKPKEIKPAMASGASRPVAGTSAFMRSLLTVVLLVIIVAGGLYLLSNYTGLSVLGGEDINLQTDWQAVFLDNGQVYFGKVTKLTENTVVLADIYYLQVVTQPLQRSQQGENPQPQEQEEQRLTLIKLGNEIHGPRDEMSINREHVVIIEDLKNDSRVVQAINDYLQGGNRQPAQ